MNITLADYLKASYPCLFLCTAEPGAAEMAVYSALRELDINMRVGVWSCTRGLLVSDHVPEVGAETTTALREERGGDSFMDALDFLANDPKRNDNPLITIFYNVRHYLNSPEIVQKIIDTVAEVEESASHLIFTGAHIDLPIELQSMVTWVDIPLPSQEDLESEIKKMVAAYRNDITIPNKREDLESQISLCARAAAGLDILSAKNAFALSISKNRSLDIETIQAQKQAEIRKSDVLEFFPWDAEMRDVGGFSEFKQWISRRRAVFSKEARDYGLPYPKGALIVGQPGAGKSLAAKATASYLELPLLRLDMGRVFRSLVGSSEEAMRTALKTAEGIAPVVLWLDEIEKALAGSRASSELDSGVTSRVISTFLTWRQETKAPVFIMATANDVSGLEGMVQRRFDAIWAVDLPISEVRKEIFEIHLRKRGRDPEQFDTALLAKKAEGFVGSEIEQAVIDGLFYGFFANREVATDDILASIKETIPQSVRNKEEIEELRKWMDGRARLVDKSDSGKKNGAGKVRTLK